MAMTFDVKTTGVDHLIDRLKGFEKDAYAILQKDVKAAADKIGKSARGMIPAFPLSGWGPWEAGRLDFYGPTVSSSIKPSFRSRRVGGQRYVAGMVSSKSAPAAIYALAGSKSDGPFSDHLNSMWGSRYPRALGPAWTLHVDEARDEIQDAIYRAAEKVT